MQILNNCFSQMKMGYCSNLKFGTCMAIAGPVILANLNIFVPFLALPSLIFPGMRDEFYLILDFLMKSSVN